MVRAVARVPLRGGFVADREVADSGLWPSLGFVGLRPTMHSWPEGNNPQINPEMLEKCASCHESYDNDITPPSRSVANAVSPVTKMLYKVCNLKYVLGRLKYISE